MELRGSLIAILIWSLLPLIAAIEGKPDNPDTAGGYRDWGSSQNSISRRQAPVVIAPPTAPKPITYTPPALQPTSSLNYWWPYGSNGVNPTATPTPTPVSATDLSDTDTMDDSAPETTTTDKTTTSASSSSSNDSSSVTTTATTTATPIPLPIASPQGFRVISLLPLFIILGVIALATLIGWTYGRCARWCQSRKEPTPGGANIGRRPYEFGGYDSDTIGPMRPVGMGWVDASRMYDHNVSSAAAYHAVRTEQKNEEPGTPSKKKPRPPKSGGWFRHTFSRKKRLNEDSPSGEKGLRYPSANGAQHLGHVSPVEYGRLTSRVASSPASSGSPKLLRVVNGSPSTLGARLSSPLTSSQPTPYVSASRHGSLRRKIFDKVQAEDEEHLLAASKLPGAYQKLEDLDSQEGNWTNFKADPLKRSPARRFNSSNSPKSPQSLTRSPDPQQHRARMRRLRATVQTGAVAVDDVASPQTSETGHPLLVESETMLSPPLRAHLFFDGDCSKEDESRGVQDSSDDPFGPCIVLSPQPMQRAGGKRKSPKKRSESTETVPLSPELRGAAMTRFEEIVKTSWSTRNLAGIPQSPTMFGALSPPPSHGFCEKKDDCRTGAGGASPIGQPERARKPSAR